MQSPDAIDAMTDGELLTRTEALVRAEREAMTAVIRHLREIQRRRLYSELGYQSLFDYAVRHLKYSEGQAGRRIQAMRLVDELPEIESRIESGALSLTNVSQAQGFFREYANQKSAEGCAAGAMSRVRKLEILAALENKSSRDGEKELVRHMPDVRVPKELVRQVAVDIVEMNFLASDALRVKLEEVRSLMGPEGAGMTLAQLIELMAELSLEALASKRFGKHRAGGAVSAAGVPSARHPVQPVTPAPESRAASGTGTGQGSQRYISPGVKHFVWHRDGGKCVKCESRRNLNFDHIMPVARGGASTPDNLRLLCFFCNQRAGISEFGITAMQRRDGGLNRTERS